MAAAAWLLQRGIQELANSRARASDDPRTSVGVLAGSMIARGWLVAGSIFAVGMLGAREDGLAAAILEHHPVHDLLLDPDGRPAPRRGTAPGMSRRNKILLIAGASSSWRS